MFLKATCCDVDQLEFRSCAFVIVSMDGESSLIPTPTPKPLFISLTSTPFYTQHQAKKAGIRAKSGTAAYGISHH